MRLDGITNDRYRYTSVAKEGTEYILKLECNNFMRSKLLRELEQYAIVKGVSKNNVTSEMIPDIISNLCKNEDYKIVEAHSGYQINEKRKGNDYIFTYIVNTYEEPGIYVAFEKALRNDYFDLSYIDDYVTLFIKCKRMQKKGTLPKIIKTCTYELTNLELQMTIEDLKDILKRFINLFRIVEVNNSKIFTDINLVEELKIFSLKPNYIKVVK